MASPTVPFLPRACCSIAQIPWTKVIMIIWCSLVLFYCAFDSVWLMYIFLKCHPDVLVGFTFIAHTKTIDLVGFMKPQLVYQALGLHATLMPITALMSELRLAVKVWCKTLFGPQQPGLKNESCHEYDIGAPMGWHLLRVRLLSSKHLYFFQSAILDFTVWMGGNVSLLCQEWYCAR